MKNIDIFFTTEYGKKQFVLECEADFEKRLSDISKKAIESCSKILLLSGPTCSGKTTAAKKIINDFSKIGKNVIIVSIDDFFKDRKEVRKVNASQKIDYDSVDVIDLEELKKCVHQAFHEKKMRVPIFDFLTQSRVGYNEYPVNQNDIIIFEGIQAVYPEVLELFKNEDVSGIFINVDNDVILNGTFFSRDDIRLVRRIVRDRKFRGASAEFTLYLWETVRENEDKNIYPNKNVCKIQIDSFMEYELFLIKPYLIEALNEVDKNGEYFKKAIDIKEKFEALQEISYDYIPENSLYTEFLGKKD